MLIQVSVYAENRKGTLRNLTEILANQGINIWGSMTNDGAEFGINRMILSEPQKALAAFREAGYLCSSVDVIGVELEDEVGNLNHLMEALTDSNINIDYLYLSFNRKSGKPVMVFHTEDIYEAEESLAGRGFCVL